MIRKWLRKRITEPMVMNFLEKKGVAMCKMCDNICHVQVGVCDICSYELDMMHKKTYEQEVLG